MKVALVYTGTTPELVEFVEKEIRKHLSKDVELLQYEDPTILDDAVKAGYVTRLAAVKLISMYMKAVKEGAEAILNLCSSVGEVADAAQDIAKYIGVPIVRVDEEMCREAVRKGKRIGVMATLSSTLNPTKNTIIRVARELGKEVVLIDALVEGAFGLNQEQFKSLMLEKAAEIVDDVDLILFAQGSMAYCEEIISDEYDKLVLSSPRFGAKALKEALVARGFEF